jgi:D-glycero-alpha-D-manno-heptose 1-phosphate guanylyltransferase
VQALILCGGFGTRLRGVVQDAPKAMAPINGTPFLELLIDVLRKKGVHEIVLATGYKAEQIEQHFGTGTRWGVSIAYSREATPLGTGGAIKQADSLLGERFLVLNGDTFAEFDLAAMTSLFDGREAQMVMALKTVADVARYGSVLLDSEQRVSAFVEKGSSAGGGYINAGIYLVRRPLLEEIAPGRAVSLENDVMPGVLAQGGLFACEMPGAFIDIGVPEDYFRAQTLLAGEV